MPQLCHTSALDLAFILERAADSRLARMRLALAGATVGSRRGSAAGCRPPLPLRRCAGVR